MCCRTLSKFKPDQWERCLQHLLGTFFFHSYWYYKWAFEVQTMSMRLLFLTPARHVFFISIDITGGHLKFKLDEQDHCLQHLLSMLFFHSNWYYRWVFEVHSRSMRCAEQVLQTTVSFTWYELHMPTYKINRSGKKMCRAGFEDNSHIDIVWTLNVILLYQ